MVFPPPDGLRRLACALLLLGTCAAPGQLTFDPDNPPTSSTPPTEIYNEYTGTYSHQKGPKTVMVFLVQPSDGAAWTNPPTFATLNSQLNTASQNYYNTSYRQTWFGPKRRNGADIERLVVTPVLILPRTAAEYRNSFSLLQNDCLAAARAQGGDWNGGVRDPDNFDRWVVMSNTNMINSTGLAFVGGRFAWTGGSLSGSVAEHEWGHNWGVYHANSWIVEPGMHPRSGSGVSEEYKDGWDLMGGGSPSHGFNPLFLEQLGFLERSRGEVLDVTSSGTYRIFNYRHPHRRNDSGTIRALLIPSSSFTAWGRVFLGFGHMSGTDGGWSRTDWNRNAVTVHSKLSDGSNRIDTTPFSRSVDDANDSSIKIGRTYSERPPDDGSPSQMYGGFHVTPIARGNSTFNGVSHEWIDVVVNYENDILNNQPPAASFSQGIYDAATGTPLALTVNASDPNGDAPAFDWDFGDNTYNLVSSSNQTKTWAAPGFYLVRCTVSDMKGGLADAYTWANVGNQTFAPPASDSVSAGLHYRYHEGSWNTLPNFDNLLPVATGTCTGFDLGVRQRNTNFGIVYTGFIEVPAQNVYQFRIRHDDGVRLVVAGQTVINQPGEVGAPQESVGNVALQAGRHAIRLEYFLRTGTPTLQVRYWIAGGEETPVPNAWLSQNTWTGNQAPAVAITAPGAGEQFVVNSDILIQANASDDQGIARVAFFGNGAYLGQDTTAPYEVTWEKVSVGAKTLVAVAYDTAGRYTISAPVAIQVNNPPPAQGFGINFGAQNDNTRLQFGESAGAVYSYPNWNNISGSTGNNTALVDHLGLPTPIRLSFASDGAGSGTYETLGDIGSPNGRLMRGGVNRRFDIEPADNPNPWAEVSNIPYTNYDVYVYFDYINNNADDTVVQRYQLTPSAGPTPAAKFGRNSASHTNGVGDYPTYDTFNGFREATATSLNATASELFGNYVVFRNQSAPSFKVEATRNNPATYPGSTGRHRRFFNAIQVIERPATEPALVIRRVGGASTVSESGQTAAVTVALAVPPTGNVTVTVAPDSQLNTDTTSLTFTPANYNQPRVVTIGAVDDTLAEGPHTGTVTFSASGANYGGVAAVPLMVQIQDNDLANVSVSRVRNTAEDPSPVPGEFLVTRTGVGSLSTPITVPFSIGGTATPDADYTLSGTGVTFNAATGNGTVALAAGVASVRVLVTPVDDTVAETAETVVLTLQEGSGYQLATASATLRIFDNDSTNYFTQFFASGQLETSFDLSNKRIILTPDGSPGYYSGQTINATSYLHSSTLGTQLVTANNDDTPYLVNRSVKFHGTTYSQFWVSPNGYLTFNQSDNTWTPTLNNHFARVRLSLFFADQFATSGTTTIYHAEAGAGADRRVVVTFNNLHVRGQTNQRYNAQVELWDNGTITITYLNCHVGQPVIAGLSNRTNGQTPADFVETDLSEMGALAAPAAAPVFATLPPLHAVTGQVYSYALAVFDPNSDPVTLTAPVKPAWLNLVDHGNGTATLSGTPPAAGGYAITLRASDGTLQTDQSYTLLVGPAGANTPPAFTSTPPTAVNALSTYTYTVTAADADGQVPQISASLLPGWLALTDHGNGTATLSGTAPDAEVTSFPVTLVAADGLASSAQSFTIQVNRAPQIQILDPLGATGWLSGPGTLQLSAQVTDDGLPNPPGAVALSWTLVSGPGTVQFSDAASATTTADFPSAGDYRLRLTANDGAAATTRDVFVTVGGDPNTALNSGLLGYWKFDETSGTSAADSSGNGNHLTMNGSVSFGPGVAGNALVASASNTQYAERAGLAQPTQFTFTGWVQTSVSPADSSDERHIFSFTASGSARSRLTLNRNVSTLRFRSTHQTPGLWETTQYRLPANTWVHVALSYDQSSTANNPVLYINGEPVGMTRVTAPSGSLQSTNAFRVGGRGSQADSWKGRIDEARLYNRILNPAEVVAAAFTDALNQAPVVTAALRDPIPEGQSEGYLIGTVEDDGLPAGSGLSILWSKLSGPGDVTFANEEALEGPVSFSAPGTYVLALTASDGAATTQATVTVVIVAGSGQPPAAPSGLGATAVSSTQINVSWTDNSDDETGFVIERSLDGTNFAAALTTGANATTWSDTGREPGATYHYRVRAVNAHGQSAAAGPVSATTWTRLAQWNHDHGLPPDAAALDDADGDGVVNLLEYALGGNPNSASSAPRPQVGTGEFDGQQYLVITVPKNPAATDLACVVEISTDLGTWRSGAGHTVVVSESESELVVRAAEPLSAQPRQFLRVRAVLP